jgi:glycosyltransferase involved in cell wall biosynthesis
MSAPPVSVVVPLYEGERYIAAALESIARQDYECLETIVVDDGSTDSGPAVVRRFPHVRYLRQAHENVAAARNRGVAEACGTYVAFLDQDDIWMPDSVSRRVAVLERDDSLGLVVAAQHNFEEVAARPAVRSGEQLPGKSTQLMLGTTLVRREVFERVGLFDSRSGISSDFEWFARARRAGVRFAFLDEIVLKRRLHDLNNSNDLPRQQRSLLASVKLLLDESRSGTSRPP